MPSTAAPARSLHIGVFGASGYAGAELLRLAAAHPGLGGGAGDRRDPGRRPGRRPVPEPGRGLSRSDPVGGGPGRCRWPRRGVPGPPARRVPGPGPRAAQTGRARRRPGRRLPSAGPGPLPAVVRIRAPLPGPAGRGRHRHPGVVSRRAARRHPGGGRRLLPHGGRPGPGAAGPGRPDRRRRGSWWTPPAGCRARAGSPSRTPTSTPWTRTSPPTACSTTGTPRRSSRPSARAPRSSSPRTWLR